MYRDQARTQAERLMKQAYAQARTLAILGYPEDNYRISQVQVNGVKPRIDPNKSTYSGTPLTRFLRATLSGLSVIVAAVSCTPRPDTPPAIVITPEQAGLPSLTEASPTDDLPEILLPVGSDPTAETTPTAEVAPTEATIDRIVPLRPVAEVSELAGINFDLKPIQQLYPDLTNFSLLAATNGMQGDDMRYTLVIQADNGGQKVLILPVSYTVGGTEHKAEYPAYFDPATGGKLVVRIKDIVYSLYRQESQVSAQWQGEYPKIVESSKEGWKSIEAVDANEWPFPDDPVVETIKFTNEEMEAQNPEYYNEVAPIFSESGMIIKQWMKLTDTEEALILAHHRDGGGLFLFSDYKYSKGHFFYGLKTSIIDSLMEENLLQPSTDGRLVAMTIRDLPEQSLDQFFSRLAVAVSLRARRGEEEKMPKNLDSLKVALDIEEKKLTSPINIIYMQDPIDPAPAGRLPVTPFKMNNYMVGSGDIVTIRSGYRFSTNQNTLVIYDQTAKEILGFKQPPRMFTTIRGTKTIERIEKNPKLKDPLSKFPYNSDLIRGAEVRLNSITSRIFFSLNSKYRNELIFSPKPDGLVPVLQFYNEIPEDDLDQWELYVAGETDSIPKGVIDSFQLLPDHAHCLLRLVQ